MRLPDSDYLERVYAGTLGKLIGVYLGRPFEGWSFERIQSELGEISYYVHERFDRPLIVADDDISGTFTFLRALPDRGNHQEISSAQIGESWLNYIVEQKTILWWGGVGNSTEHTAYLRLKNGIKAPWSGSMALNGKLVAEQVGAQIFIDGWAMVAPGNPTLAAKLAEQAARVSHDGEAVYAAKLLAAMEAQAFLEGDIQALIETGLSYIPKDSLITQMVGDIRRWAQEDNDWYGTRQRIATTYGYNNYGGHCHVVPNHAIIILSLLYCDDNFQKALLIANTSGWDTDCNSGNVGCLLGIKNGLAGLETGPDWRGPIADRLYLSAADGTRAITDAVQESIRIVNIGKALAGQAPLSAAKGGARFHFDLSGSLQGFQGEVSAEDRGTLSLENVMGHSDSGSRSLALHYDLLPDCTAYASTATFIPPEALTRGGYQLLGSPTLQPGQTVTGRLEGDKTNSTPITCRPFVRIYNADDQLDTRHGSAFQLTPSQQQTFRWKVGDTGGFPIAQVGIALESSGPSKGSAYLDFLTWDGVPETCFHRPPGQGRAWLRSWVDAVDHVGTRWPNSFHLSQDRGRGLFIQGGDWHDYQVSAEVKTYMAKAIGLAVRVQGLERYYALLLESRSCVKLLKRLSEDVVLAEREYPWEFDQTYTLSIRVDRSRIIATINNEPIFDISDPDPSFDHGGIALLCEEGVIMTDKVWLHPLAEG